MRGIENCNFQVINSEELRSEDLTSFTHIAISPGPMTPADYPILKDVIEYCLTSGKPLLGICLGHQAIGTYFGAKLTRLDHVIHGQQHTIEVTQKNDLFDSLPTSFSVGLYHSWVLSTTDFPEELEITAYSKELIMAIQHKTSPIYGIQFHPESFLTSYGKEILTNFLSL
ncbi:MAG: gamma-glutamyl-gamma-aminobutyrate hydrolase family protein [Brumimicrobium sp.]|nr:gamma-glutamyl-gamma-aminobutyrate hydrolase family protein [Brumimicrobium sp.]